MHQHQILPTKVFVASVAAVLLMAASQTAAAADAVKRAGSSASSAASSVVTSASAAISKVGRNTDEKQWERSHRASKIIGTDVRNRQGEKVGDVKEVVLDNNGTVSYVVVSTGGFLGIGDRLHAVPWSALDKHAEKDFNLDIDKATLKNAPGFDSKHWPNFADEQWQATNRKFYKDWSDSAK